METIRDPRVLLIQSRPETDVAENELESICRLGGIDPTRVERLRIERDELTEIDLDRYAAIIMGGGPANFASPEDKKSVEQKRYEEWLIAFVQKVIAEDKPFLGMCLGIGVVAMASGARPSFDYGEAVEPVEIEIDEIEANDPLLAGLPKRFYALVGHKEGIDEAPAGCVELARSRSCVQMLRCGANVYATQFHPELDVPGLAVRVEAYKHHGYFPPDEGDEIVTNATKADISHAVKVLKNFVRRYGIAQG